jgi:hypothetical protein
MFKVIVWRVENARPIHIAASRVRNTARASARFAAPPFDGAPVSLHVISAKESLVATNVIANFNPIA